MWSRVLAVAVIAVALSGCSDPQTEANERLTEIGQLVEKSKNAAPLDALAQLRSAEERLNVLVQEYGSTDVGARLATGDAIGEVSRGNIRQLLKFAERTACLEYPTADCIEDIVIEHLNRPQDSITRSAGVYFAARESWATGNVNGVRKLLPFMEDDNLARTEVSLTLYSQKILTDEVIESTLSPLTNDEWQSAIDPVMLALYMSGDLERACRLRAFIHDRFPATIGKATDWFGLAILVTCKSPGLDTSIAATLRVSPTSAFGAVAKMLEQGEKERANDLVIMIIRAIDEKSEDKKALELALLEKDANGAVEFLKSHTEPDRAPLSILLTAEVVDAVGDPEVAKSLFLQVGQNELVEIGRDYNRHIIEMAVKFLPADAARKLFSAITKAILDDLKKQEEAGDSYLMYPTLWQAAEAIRSAKPPAK